MQLVQESIEEIEEIMHKIDCPFRFRCEKSGFEDLCGELVGQSGKFVSCSDPRTAECGFSIQLGSSFLCACPLRIYIARTFKK
ncbi:MAG: hypothetical protein ACYTBW_05865 [Planctomycetota bacterium]|jgi:hypothetical protein